jgi:phage-related protein
MDSEQLKPVRWVGSSLKDLKSFPPEVKAEVGRALCGATRRHRPRGQATEGFRRRQRNGDRRAIRWQYMARGIYRPL